MGQAKKILLVDDDLALTEMLSELLQTEGYEAIVANNGSEGLLKEREEKPDLVILDVMMPGDDGISTLRKLRETSEVAVLMLTAMGEDDDRVLGLEAGADDYLAKPFVARELVLRIQAILRRLTQAPNLPQRGIGDSSRTAHDRAFKGARSAGRSHLAANRGGAAHSRIVGIDPG